MGNEAPSWKNLTSPSVSVFLQDCIKSALNTLIQAQNDLSFRQDCPQGLPIFLSTTSNCCSSPKIATERQAKRRNRWAIIRTKVMARGRCCIDVGHRVRAGTDVVQAIHEAGTRLYNVRMKDLMNFQDKQSQVGVGDGKMPVRKIFEALVAEKCRASSS